MGIADSQMTALWDSFIVLTFAHKKLFLHFLQVSLVELYIKYNNTKYKRYKLLCVTIICTGLEGGKYITF